MSPLVVELDDVAGRRFRQRAEQEGVTPGELARRLLTEAVAGDPFEFFDAGSSDSLRGSAVDHRLTERGFGER